MSTEGSKTASIDQKNIFWELTWLGSWVLDKMTESKLVSSREIKHMF